MSDAHDDALLTALRLRQRDLELDACAIRARVAEVTELIALVEGRHRRRGRPRNVAMIQMPDRVEGAANQPEEGAAA